jgi:ribonucleoside-triphosphate reductase
MVKSSWHNIITSPTDKMNHHTNVKVCRWETVERVVNGTFNMQKRWIDSNDLNWDAAQAQLSAQNMYDRIYKMKFLPPGRGLWAMGSPLTEERKMFAALNNCAFVSTETMWDGNPSLPFTFMMDSAMLG